MNEQDQDPEEFDGDPDTASDEAGDDLEDGFPLGDGTADTEIVVYCPYCGEPVEMTLDPGGGPEQEYVEDCSVCCRPWQVFVSYDRAGKVHVSATSMDE